MDRQLCRLTPVQDLNQVLRYLLLLYCSRNAEALEVTAYCALSNHHHLIVRDLRGGADSKVSAFCRDFHATLAKCLNTFHDCSGVAWDPNGSFSDVEIHGFEAETEQWVYVAGQAVAAGLVERPEDWPGVHWLPEDIGRTLTAKRPDFLFSTSPTDLEEDEAFREAEARLREKLNNKSKADKKRGRTRRRRKQLAKERENRGRSKLPSRPKPTSTLPEVVSYTVPIPQFLEDAGMDVDEARAYLRAALDLYVDRLHEERREQGLGFLGAEAVLAQDPLSPPPKTHVDADHPATYAHVPTLATKGLSKGEVREIKDELAQWHADYDEAWELFQSKTPQRARFPKGAHLRAQDQRRLRIAYRAHAPPRAA